MLKVGVLVNWGVGLEVLETLHRMDGVEIGFVVTRGSDTDIDPWAGVVEVFAQEHGHLCADETVLSFAALRNMIVDQAVDLLVCHAYGRILPLSVIEAPTRGSLNIHCSLLPKYRGPSPQHWILKNKEEKSGITYHLMDEGIDSGPVVHQVTCDIQPDKGLDAMLEKLKDLVADSLPVAIDRLCRADFLPLVQNHALATYAPRPRVR